MMADEYSENLMTSRDVLTTYRMVIPPSPNWKIHITGNTYFTVVGAPNAFNRWMQRICFGVRWEKIPK